MNSIENHKISYKNEQITIKLFDNIIKNMTNEKYNKVLSRLKKLKKNIKLQNNYNIIDNYDIIKYINNKKYKVNMLFFLRKILNSEIIYNKEIENYNLHLNLLFFANKNNKKYKNKQNINSTNIK